MRLGLLGLGRIGSFHAETLSGLAAVDSLVVSDPAPALAAGMAERLGADTADTPAALLASGVDGVVIAAPTGAHPELILSCVAAGLPTFCEKPVASTPGRGRGGRDPDRLSAPVRPCLRRSPHGGRRWRSRLGAHDPVDDA